MLLQLPWPQANLVPVQVGCTIKVISMPDGLHCGFKLVANTEPDLNKGELCQYSPLGQALLGKRPGEQVRLTLPGVAVHFLITDIQNGMSCNR